MRESFAAIWREWAPERVRTALATCAVFQPGSKTASKKTLSNACGVEKLQRVSLLQTQQPLPQAAVPAGRECQLVAEDMIWKTALVQLRF